MSETQSAIPASATASPIDVGEMLRRHRTKPVDPGTAAAMTAPPAAKPKEQAEAAGGSPEQLLKAAQAAMTEFQKPEPKSEQTTPEQTWGSMAMAVASLGGLLTHTPVTTSLNAMAGVVKATRENDTERAKQEFDRWKVAHEASAKMVDYTLKLYDEALKTTGPRAQLAAIQAVDAQLKLNENRAFLAAAGGDPIVAAKMRHAALSKAAAGATGAAAEFEGIHAKNVALGEVVAGKVAEREAALGRKLTKAERGQVFLDAEAAQKAAEAGLRTEATAKATPPNMGKGALLEDEDGTQYLQFSGNGLVKYTTLTGEAYTPKHASRVGAAKPEDRFEIGTDPATGKQFMFRLGRGGTPEYRDLAGNAIDPPGGLEKGGAAREPTAGSSAATQAAVEKDVRAAHPEWTPGQVATAAKRAVSDSNHQTMGDDAAKLMAQIAIKTGHPPAWMSRSEASMRKFLDTYAAEAKTQGVDAKDISANMVRFNMEMAEARMLGSQTARVDFAARELEVALPQALELSEIVFRPGFRSLAEIQQAIQGQTSDPDLLEFMQQNRAVISAYATAMQRGGVSTVNSMDRAEHMLRTATSQQGYARQLDRLNKEVQTIKYGSDAAKRDLLNEVTGGRYGDAPPPRLTGVPRAGGPGRAPPRKQWIEEHRSDNPGVSDTELGAYYDRTHGG